MRSIEIAAACLAGAEEFHRIATAARETKPATAAPHASEASARLVAAARAEGRQSLLEPEALELLASEGIAVPPFALLRAQEDELTGIALGLKDAGFGQLDISTSAATRLGWWTASHCAIAPPVE